MKIRQNQAEKQSRLTIQIFILSFPPSLPSFQQEEVVKIVRLITQLLLYGEGLEDERMFEFFGQKNLLLAFCHMVRKRRREGGGEGGINWPELPY